MTRLGRLSDGDTARPADEAQRGSKWASWAAPPFVAGAGSNDAVWSIFLEFDRQTQRQRSILRLAMVGLMVLVVLSATPTDEWPAQLALVGVYGALSLIAAWVWLRRPERARRLRAVEPMVPIDIAAVCGLQFLSTGRYLVLGVLAFLPFFIATQTGRRAAFLSLASIVAGGVAVVADPVFLGQLSALEIVTILVMLSVLCLCSYTVSRVQERRLVSVAELTAGRSLLLADVMTAEERERRRIAEALHDGALQTLLAAKQDLRDVLRGKDDDRGIQRASELVESVSEELRQVTRELHPAVLHEAGVAAAVQTLAQAFSERTAVPVELAIDYPFAHAGDAALYGVARELLNNVARHAHAQKVRLELRDEGTELTLIVRDDGVGMDPAVISQRLAEGHIGLASHRARIETLGGRIDFESVERGTSVYVRLPARYQQEAS
ncbi:sensor histidine kinase [Antrihabitans sp. YC2-6]|uniref:sensor histidine kinase n=1 Tax=Antrihabitans sp. YC2-6 TaxID=2799498 RepID=UPI0018F37B71|nr:ATP-binding protein [Antrihabitans sp. YC2-6]MBJ8346936.1 sensor histidine kinase [Antrihabitans sp. YC2-6]